MKRLVDRLQLEVGNGSLGAPTLDPSHRALITHEAIEEFTMKEYATRGFQLDNELDGMDVSKPFPLHIDMVKIIAFSPHSKSIKLDSLKRCYFGIWKSDNTNIILVVGFRVK